MYKIPWMKKFPCFQLRYLQTLNSIAAEHNSTIIFPMPIDIGHLGRMLK
jgi:hypothetical protein